MTLEIIYRDEDLIVVNKPPGIPVHGGDTIHGVTLAQLLLVEFPELGTVGDDPATRPGIVHRLDRDTSGVMVVARNQKSFAVLKSLFQERQVEKTYWAIVCGRPKERRGTVALPIGRLVKNPTKRGVSQGQGKVRGAREAVTAYRVLKESKEYSLLELSPKTGRMHQIRVHLKAIGHPVACDTIYGGKKVCCPEGAKRMLLHAKSLAFSFPAGRRLSFEADPPQDFMLAERAIF